MKKIVCTIFILFLVSSCSKIDFVYKNSGEAPNPIYNKTAFLLTGVEIPSSYEYFSRYLGKADIPEYIVEINIEEEQTKRSVQTNQAISNLDYELFFNYKLTNISDSCVLYNTSFSSRFTYMPKSSGYNFGSDQSLQKLYGLAIQNSLERFINFISELDLNSCNNEN